MAQRQNRRKCSRFSPAITSDATLDGTLEIEMAQGELSRETAEAFVWKNRKALLGNALHDASAQLFE
jgi:hypothetical protein